MPPPTLASLEKRYYGCNYPNYGDNCDNGLSYGARVGIGIGIAAAAFFVILLLSIFARQRRQRALQSMRPQFQTNPAYQPQGGQAYMPQTGYVPGGEPQGYGAHYNTGAPAPTYGGNANSSYPPPAGPPPADQPEMVNGQIYAPPTQPPPAYQHKAADV